MHQFFLLKTGKHVILSGPALEDHVKSIINEMSQAHTVTEEDVVSYVHELNNRICAAIENKVSIDFAGMEIYSHIAEYDFIIRFRNNFWPAWIQMDTILVLGEKKILEDFGVGVSEIYKIVDKIYAGT